MLILNIFFACLKRWWHCLTHMFFTNPTHRECSLTTKTDEVFYLKIYCECGKVFGEWKVEKEEKNK